MNKRKIVVFRFEDSERFKRKYKINAVQIENRNQKI